ncbi:MAG TPA: adenylate/guanylate cyclase domain-containing protein [Deltaproteobacteria bacterium]|nr:adenylate/guanylate cyclase domain-containing protein [Deltaproteobacteria bacterium]
MASRLKSLFKFRPIYISISAILIGSAAYLTGIPFLDLMELKTIDLRFTSRGDIKPGPDVVLAVIHEKSLAREGKWPWPRAKMAALVKKLSDAGAKVIAFDIGFLEPDNKRLVEMLDAVEQKIQGFSTQSPDMREYFERLKHQSDYDRLLAEAIRDSKAKVVLGFFFQMDKGSAGHIGQEALSAYEKLIRGSAYKMVHYTSGLAQKAPLREALAPQPNIAGISQASEYAGTFSMVPDLDGVVRRMPAVIKFKDLLYAPLSLVAISAFKNEPISLKIADYGVESVRIGKLEIPSDELGQIVINYRGKEKTYPHIPVTDIIHGNVPDGTFKDKIVLVGVTATAIYDMRVTPFGNVFPGLEIHANLIDTVLSEDFLRQPAWTTVFDLLFMVVGGLMLGFVLPRVGAFYGALFCISVFIGHILICQFFFSDKGWILNVVYPLSVILLLYVGKNIYKYLVEARQKRWIRGAFSTYLAPSVVQQLIDSPDKLILGGEQRDITAFFSDVQGFTSISEKLTPHELVELLNEFLTEMTDIILRHEGTVDKFEGDAIIAFFGAPNELKNHPEVACNASIDMQNRMIELRNHWRGQDKPELKMRIGLCTGPAVVGNMGSKNRMDYTMMGDTVNTAARLEGVNKIYGIYTLVSNSTHQGLNGNIFTREIDSINVVGRDEPVTVYELMGYRGDIDSNRMDMTKQYAAGLHAYRNQQWDKAVELFQAALSLVSEDGPSKTMLERCFEFKESPPGKGWNGSYTMRSK